MKSFFKKREFRITKKQAVIAAVGIVLLVAIYWFITHRPAPAPDLPVVAVVKMAKKAIRIPVLGNVAAGVPIEAIEDVIDYEEISEELAHTGDFFALKIKGDSMEPRICNGDVVIVRKQNYAESGDLVIVLVNGDSATCKKLAKFPSGIRLIPFNQTYEPMFYSNEEIENKPVRIIGKVVENRQKY